MTSSTFISTLILIFLAVSIEALLLYLQWKKRWLSERFGDNAFKVHSVITLSFWAAASIGIIVTLFEPNPVFHEIQCLGIAGWILFGVGMNVATLGFKELGLERSLGINFFNEDVNVVSSGIYEYTSNPEEYGFWIMMLGFALGTGSCYILAYAIEFIVLMIPNHKIENLPLEQENVLTA